MPMPGVHKNIQRIAKSAVFLCTRYRSIITQKTVTFGKR
jgi:hypothetical protein